MPGRKIRDEADARSCLSAAERSGTTRTAWANANFVDARSLQAWRLILQRKDAKAHAIEFLELVPTNTTPPPSPTLTLRHETFAIDVPADFDERHLQRLLRVVATC